MISSSCEEFLTVRTESSFNEETIFSNPALAENAIMGIYESINYNSFNGRLWAYHGYNNDTERSIGSESGMTESDTHRAYAVYKYDESNDYFGSAYTYAYNAIERANNCISGLKKYGNVSEESSMAYYLGEALFLRAWLYYELIGLWGNIPARFEPATNETVYLGRSDRDVIWKKLLSDLEEASELLPWPGLGKASTILRPSKAAAKALRARIALTAGG